MGDAGPLDYRCQTVVYPSRTRDHRQHLPRQPTPETSHSSNGSLDEQIPRTCARDGMRDCYLLIDDRPDERDECSLQSDGSAVMRDDSHNRHAPRPRPYQHVDNRKPSLPPLKAVLNGTSNSPPGAHLTLHSSFQLGPHEPSFTPSTYKPPGLYPNKKPRAESSFDSLPTWNSRSSMSSPGLATTAIEHRSAYPVAKESVSHGPSTPRLGFGSNRRLPFCSAPLLKQEQTSPGTVDYQHSRGFINDSHHRAHRSTASDHHRCPEQSGPPSSRAGPLYTHSSVAQRRPAADYFGSSSSDHHASSSVHATSRRSSIMSQRECAPSPIVEPSRISSGHSRSPHYSHCSRDKLREPEQSQYVDRNNARQSEPYTRAVYQHAHPTFFMPSHYERQQGKRRKRSNLPKQSIEIMETWFDQNIANPYPSEYQKSLFSNAAGISMTQVSNWFINHRRRCPELRKKRDMARISGLDGGE